MNGLRKFVILIIFLPKKSKTMLLRYTIRCCIYSLVNIPHFDSDARKRFNDRDIIHRTPSDGWRFDVKQIVPYRSTKRFRGEREVSILDNYEVAHQTVTAFQSLLERKIRKKQSDLVEPLSTILGHELFRKIRKIPLTLGSISCSFSSTSLCGNYLQKIDFPRYSKRPENSRLEDIPSPSDNDEGIDGTYDPHEHRTHQKHVSDFGSFANMVKSAAGTGLFAIPNAFACVGMLLGIVGTIVMGILITISLQLLMKTHHVMCKRVKRPSLTYDKLVSVTMTSGSLRGRISPEFVTLIVDIAMLACYIGIGAVYVVFVSGIVQECVDMDKTINQAYYSIIIFPIFLLMNLVKGLNSFAPISMMANALLVIAAVIGIIYALKEGKGEWVFIEKNVTAYPKFIGTAFFSMCSPGLVLAIEHSMKKPWNYTKVCGVLNWGMAFLITLHVIVGAVVYSQWGSDSLGNFIRNHPEHNAGTFTVLVMQGIAIYLSYGLQCYMPISILYEDYAVPSIQDGACKGTPFLWDLVVRFGVTAVTCILAVAVPQLHLFTSLVGALCIATLGTIIPSILYIVSQYGNFGRFLWRLILAIVVLIVGILAMACGTVSSVILIVRYLRYGDE